jgi:osmotically-inducible protein OsmY
MTNDTQIQQDVITELDHDQSVPIAIGVEVHHGVVKLAGRINDSAAKKNAEVAARRVSGVTDVVMDMEISKR